MSLALIPAGKTDSNREKERNEIKSDTEPCSKDEAVGDWERGYSNRAVWQGPWEMVIFELNSA